MSTTLVAVDLMIPAARAGELCRREEEGGAPILQMLDPCVNALAAVSFEVEVVCALIVVVSVVMPVNKDYFVGMCASSNNAEYQGTEWV
jgi:hypothetical protein